MSRPDVALTSGLIGAVALTVCHEAGRRAFPDAPRMDVLGMRALRRGMATISDDPEQASADQLHRAALAGDLVANSLYYSAVAGASATATWRRGVLLGALAGVGALVLPERMGLGTPPNSDSHRNKILTISWYLIGGLAAAAAANAMRRGQAPSAQDGGREQDGDYQRGTEVATRDGGSWRGRRCLL